MKNISFTGEKRSKERIYSDFLFVLCFLAYTFSYFGRYNFSACLSDMTDAGLLDKSFGGLISSAYLVFYGMGQFINGRLGVRISPSIMVAVGLFGSGSANVLMGSVSNKYLFLVIWAANGFFNSMLWSPIVRVFTEWITEERRARAGADISLTIPVGMTLSYVISSFMLKNSSWRGVFFTCGGFVLLGGVIWFVGVRILKPYISMMKEKAALEVTESLGEDGEKKSLSLSVFFKAGVVFVAVVALFNGSLKDAVQSWAPTFLQETCGFSAPAASLVSTLLPLFSVLGPYAAVWIDRHMCKNELSTVGILFSFAAVCLLGTALFGSRVPALAVLLPALSMCCMWGINTMIMTFVPYRFGKTGISSAVSGTLNCMAYISASACAVLYGSFSESLGWIPTVFLWMGMALFGAAGSFGFSKIWQNKRPQ